jgi:drug/metabolite transporter (DMT)-like permease
MLPRNMHTSPFRLIALGLAFAMLWASASVAAKFGLRSAEPLVLFNVRFALAGALMLAWAHGIKRERLPRAAEWKHLLVFGGLNTALYLGFFVLGLKHVAAGIGTLATATNPLLIGILAAMWAGRRVGWREWLTIALGMVGVGVATYPLLATSYASWQGLVFMSLSMLAYSVGTVYYSSVEWHLSRVAINGWQAFVGGLILVPVMLALHDATHVFAAFDTRFWLSEAWLVLPVSIVAIQLWLYLLKIDPVRASMWLFLCPIFGFVYATMLLGEPFSVFTAAGTLLVIAALYLGQRKR